MYCQSLRWLLKLSVISVTHYALGRFRRLVLRLEVVRLLVVRLEVVRLVVVRLMVVRLVVVRLVVRLVVLRLLATFPIVLQFLSVTS